MARVALTAALISAAVVASTGASRAQVSTCMPKPDVEKFFLSKHGEVPALELVQADGAVIIIYVNRDTKAWTMAVSPPGRPDIQCSTGFAGSDVRRPGDDPAQSF